MTLMKEDREDLHRILDKKQPTINLEDYRIDPPWSVDLVKKYPAYIQRAIADRTISIGLGHHRDYGFFAVELKKNGDGTLTWSETDPDRKIVAHEIAAQNPAPPEPRKYLTGWVSFCPCCGANLKAVTPDDKQWGKFCEGYREAHGTEWFLCTGVRTVELVDRYRTPQCSHKKNDALCTRKDCPPCVERDQPVEPVVKVVTTQNTDCVFKDVPLVLHNPVNGWDKPPGDNWAIGYVK